MLNFLERERYDDVHTDAYRNPGRFNYRRAYKNAGYTYALDREVRLWFIRHVGENSTTITFHQNEKVVRIGLTGTYEKTDGSVHSCPARSIHMTPFFNGIAHTAMVYAPLIERVVSFPKQQ
jgi:hypothetical protein